MARLMMVVEGIMLVAAVYVMAAGFIGEPLASGAGALVMASRAAGFALCGLLSFYYHDLYDLKRIQTFRAYRRRLPSALGLWVLLLAGSHAAWVLTGWVRALDGAAALGLLVGTGLVLPVRSAFYAVIKTARFTKRVIILGTGELAQNIADDIRIAQRWRYRLTGLVGGGSDSLSEPLAARPHPVLGPLENLPEIIKRFEPDVIVLALVERRLRLPVYDLIAARGSGTLIEDGAEFYARCTGKFAMEHVVPSSLMLSRDFVRPAWVMIARRILSCGVAAMGLVLAAPLMVVIALAIKLDSKGSIFFVQDRAGLHGQPFRLVKFRTMHPPLPTIDPTQRRWASDLVRITRVGKWLRRLYLDELPQFLNILRGDMDLVGPRPEMFDNIKAMTEQIPYYALRTTVRPGLTGWAQIKQGYSVSQDEVAEKMRYDLYYLKHMSLRFDFRIGVDTVKNILLRRGT